MFCFYEVDFKLRVRCIESVCVIVQNSVAIGQTVVQIWRFFDLSILWPSTVLDFRNSKFYLPIRLRGSQCVVITKFLSDLSNDSNHCPVI